MSTKLLGACLLLLLVGPTAAWAATPAKPTHPLVTEAPSNLVALVPDWIWIVGGLLLVSLPASMILGHLHEQRGRISVRNQDLRDLESAAERGRQPPQPAPLPAQRKLGDYAIEDVQGEGSMGTVYRVRSPKGAPLAAKIPHAAFLKDRAFAPAFVREARLNMDLTHPSIARVVEVGTYEAGGYAAVPYVVMEFLKGRPLSDMLKSGHPLDVQRSVRMARGIVDALEWANKRGLLHRDLTSNNVVITEMGEVKVMDFALTASLATRDAVLTALSRKTLQFMAPERIENYQQIDPRSDLYSLGVLMYQMVTRQFPFQGSTLAQILTAQVCAPVPPSQLNPSVPYGVEAIILKLLERSPEKRFSSARELISALADLKFPD